MTTNESDNNIRKLLQKENQKDINIKINYQIGTSVDFLDINITNINKRLRTILYHKLAAEPYILPFTSEHPRHIFRNIPHSALLRALRACSDVNDFNNERLNITMSLLLNGYPPKFIDKCFQRFFIVNASTSNPTDFNTETYDCLHKKYLKQLTRREKDHHILQTHPVQSPTALATKQWDKNVMYPRYVYNSNIANTITSKFFQWWDTSFVDYYPQLKRVKVHLAANISSTLDSRVVRKKPNNKLLGNKTTRPIS